ADGDLSAAPRSVQTTLSGPVSPGVHQIASAIHVHPNGRFVYVANRADTTAKSQAGENTLAVYAIDPQSGNPSLIQHADAHCIQWRNFSIGPSGRLLVASSIRPGFVREGDGVKPVPAAICLFRIGDDGKLGFQRRYEVEVGDKMQFWSGMV